jgi:hypothetical protein
VLGQIATLLLPAITAAAQSGNLMNWVRSNNTSQLTASLLSSARWIVRLRTNNPPRAHPATANATPRGNEAALYGWTGRRAG